MKQARFTMASVTRSQAQRTLKAPQTVLKRPPAFFTPNHCLQAENQEKKYKIVAKNGTNRSIALLGADERFSKVHAEIPAVNVDNGRNF